MWCIGTLSEEYRHRMYKLLALYAKPLRCDEPVICIDENSLQLIAHSREPLPIAPGAPAKQDYEYVRNGTTNLFVAVQPKAGQRVVWVTAHRGKADFVGFVQALLTDTYASARRVHLMLASEGTTVRRADALRLQPQRLQQGQQLDRLARQVDAMRLLHLHAFGRQATFKWRNLEAFPPRLPPISPPEVTGFRGRP